MSDRNKLPKRSLDSSAAREKEISERIGSTPAQGMMRTLTKRIKVNPSENSPRGRAFADEETRLRQRQIDVQGEIQRENDDYARRRAELLRRFGAKEE